MLSQLKKEHPFVLLTKGIILLLTVGVLAQFMLNFSVNQTIQQDFWKHFARQFPGILIWLLMAVRIFQNKKCGWNMLAFILMFSLIGVMNSFTTFRLPFNVKMLVMPLMSTLFLIFINMQHITKHFQVRVIKNNTFPLSMILMSIFLMALGLFLFIELLGNGQITTSGLITPKLFISGLGLIFILLGLGLYWKQSTALKAMQSVLIFTAVSTLIIIIKTVYAINQLPKWNVLLFFLLMTGLTAFWSFYLHKKIDNTD